jgi:excisionase family DNA binding protein
MATKASNRGNAAGADDDLLADGVLSVPKASEFLSVSRVKVYELVKVGELRFIKRGRRTYIPTRSAREYLQRGLASTPAQPEEPPHLADARAARRGRSS